jgi:hypothetical protein
VPWRSSPVGVPSRASPIRQRSCIALPGARFRAHSGSGGGNEWKGAAFQEGKWHTQGTRIHQMEATRE